LYSTCSLEPEEDEQVVSAALSQQSEAKLVSFKSRIEELRSERILTQTGSERLLPCITAEGALRLLPGVFQTDGFFAALIQKHS
jgi:16S rRNA (cytosine967-C5)-methyltransferase